MYMGHVLIPKDGLQNMAHVHDKQRIKIQNMAHVHGPCFVSHLYSLFIMYMGHALFPIFILCLTCTWAMFCFPSLFFVYHVHGPCFVSYLYSLFIMYMGHVLFPIFIKQSLSCTWAMFVSYLYSLFIMYMGHVLFPIFILCLSCTWAMFCFLSLFFVYHVHGPCFDSYQSCSLFIMYMGHVFFPIFMINLEFIMYMINKE